MSWVAAAIGGASALSAGVGYLGSQKASKLQAASAQQGLDFQKQVYGNQQGDLQPYKQAGSDALGMIGDLYGLNGGGGFGKSALDTFRRSPDYAFNFGEGARAFENSAAARGGLLGGNFARGITDYGQGTANNYLNQYTNRLMGIAGMGQGAALGGGQLASGMAGQIGQSYGNMGQAQASGVVGGANAITGAIGSGMNNYTLTNYLNRSSYQPNRGIGGGPGYDPYMNAT